MNDFRRYLVDEFAEDYQQGRMTRRQALRRIAAATGSLAVAGGILAACAPPAQPSPTARPAATTPPSPTTPPAKPSPAAATPSPAAAKPSPGAAAKPSPAAATGVTVRPDDPDIEAAMVQFPGEGATLLGYLARPRGNGPFAAVLVCHENRGLVPHIQDVTRRLAKAGYVGLAVDLLSRQGGTERVTDPAQVSGALGSAPETFVRDFQSGLRHLQGLPYVRRDRIGMVGFCFGGGMTWRVATRTPELRAAVPFYGPNPPLEDVPNVQAAVLAIYGELDQRINAGIPAIEAAMQQNRKTFEKVIYPNAAHAFHNDTGQAYNPDAARDAWARTSAWFERYLRS